MKTYAIALGAMLVFGGMFASLPYAEASPVHAKQVIPVNALPAVDRALSESISAASAGANPGVLTVDMWAVWYCPIGPCTIDVSTSANCITSLTAPVAQAAQKKYILRLVIGGAVATGSHTGESNMMVDPTYGNGGTHNMAIDMNGAVPAGLVEWVELLQGAGTDQTNLAGLYIFANCATFAPAGGGSVPDSIQVFFNVEVPVGGEILPINTSALLLAGLTTNALWILPALAVAAGAGIVVLKFQLYRRTI